MKLREALKQRKKLVNEISMLEERISDGMSYVPGDKIEPKGLYSKAEFESMVDKLHETRLALGSLKSRICEANNESIDESGTSIQSLIVSRGELQAEISFYKKLRDACKEDDRSGFYRSSVDTKKSTMLSASYLDDVIDKKHSEASDIDDKLSELNSKVDIPE